MMLMKKLYHMEVRISMVRSEFTFLSADGKTPIHAVVWEPETAPVGVVQLSHGVAEHIGRYEPLARFLTEHGFAVAGHDHLGHGASILSGAPRLYFGPRGSWVWAAEDLRVCREHIRARFPGIPYILLGHSMGSFLARADLIRCPGEVDGAVLIGTVHMTRSMQAAGRTLAAREERRVGSTNPSPLVTRLAFGAYNRPFAPNRTSADWISASTANVDAYLADPLCNGDPTTGLFREMLWGIWFMTCPANLRRMDPNVPVLFLSGAEDPVGENGKGVRRAAHAFRRAGVHSITLKLYPGMRHEILNEDDRDIVYRDLLCWLRHRLPSQEA